MGAGAIAVSVRTLRRLLRTELRTVVSVGTFLLVAAVPVLTLGAAVTAAVATVLRTIEIVHGTTQRPFRRQVQFFWRRWWAERWRAFPLSVLAVGPIVLGLVGQDQWRLHSQGSVDVVLFLGLCAVVSIWVVRAALLLATYPYLAGSTAVRNAAYRLWDTPRRTGVSVLLVWALLGGALTLHPALVLVIPGLLVVGEGVVYAARGNEEVRAISTSAPHETH